MAAELQGVSPFLNWQRCFLAMMSRVTVKGGGEESGLVEGEKSREDGKRLERICKRRVLRGQQRGWGAADCRQLLTWWVEGGE